MVPRLRDESRRFQNETILEVGQREVANGRYSGLSSILRLRGPR